MKPFHANRPTKLALLLTSAGLSVLAGGLAQAQTTPADAAGKPQTTSEIVVTGIKGSLQRAQAIKRSASSVVEAVTLQDLGKFSDTNVADALQRVPGVEIDRNDNGITGDRISIRGLGPAYTQVTVDGRVILTGGDEGIINMRQFNFDVLPTDTIAGIEVFKTPTAELPEAGLAGLVDITTLKPLDYHPASGKDYFGSLSVSGVYDDLAKKSASKYSAIFGGKFLDKTLGVYLGVMAGEQPTANQELFSRFTQADLTFAGTNGGPNTVMKNVLVPSQITTDINSGVNKRNSFTTGLQWKPISNFELNANFIYSKEDNNQDRSYGDIGLAANNVYTGVAQPGGYDVVANQLVGFNQNDITYTGATPQVGLTPYPLVYDNDQSLSSGGINGKWRGDKWQLAFDAGVSETTFFQDLRAFVGAGQALQGPVSYDGQPTVPTFTGFTTYNSPANEPAFISFKHYNKNDTRVQSFKADYTYYLNDSLTLKAGWRFQKTRLVVTAGTLLDVAPDATTGFTTAIADALTAAQVSNKYSGYLQDFNFGVKLPASNYYAAGPIIPSIVYGGYKGASPDLGPAFNAVETTDAGYFQADTNTTLWSVPTTGNFGLRFVQTTLHSSANSVVEVVNPLGPIESSTNVPTSDHNQYWNFLPAANLNFHLEDNLHLRLGVAEVMSRPEYNLTAPLNTISFEDPNNPLTDKSIPPQGTAGNTRLHPLTAWDYDITVEYYTPNKGALYSSIFYKDVKNFILTVQSIDQTLPGQGTTLFDVTHPLNAKTGFAYGAELGGDQPLGSFWSRLDGFGIQANYTYTEASIELPAAYGESLKGFPGTSKHNFTTIGYYEKHGIGVRVAYTYRSDYFSALTDNRTGTPTFTKGYGQLNLSASYKFTQWLEADFAVTNLTHENRRDYIPPGEFKSFVELPSIYTLGLRASF